MAAKYLLSVAGLALAALLAPVAAIGQCSFDSVTGVNFGAYDVFNNSHTDSTGTITYTCITVGTPITIDLSKGNASSYATRQMRQGASDTLDYNLFRDATRTTIWGDGTGGSSRYGPITPPLQTQVSVTVYGRIPARQNATVGSFTDTITVTINF
jgi:spore coat protein U-like protein